MAREERGAEIEVFLQGESIPEIALVRVRSDGRVSDLLTAAGAGGLALPDQSEAVVLLEDESEPLALDAHLTVVGVRNRARVHVHRCRRVEVTVNFNGDERSETFPPSATVARVKRWAVSKRGFDLNEVDAAEHLLQVCGSSVRPDEDTHIGTLFQSPRCDVCLDLVPKQRVEG